MLIFSLTDLDLDLLPLEPVNLDVTMARLILDLRTADLKSDLDTRIPKLTLDLDFRAPDTN